MTYFVSQNREYTYYLLETDSKSRAKKLGITEELYQSRKLAKEWYNNIVFKLDPMHHKDEYTTLAHKKLKELYKNMIED